MESDPESELELDFPNRRFINGSFTFPPSHLRRVLSGIPGRALLIAPPISRLMTPRYSTESSRVPNSPSSPEVVLSPPLEESAVQQTAKCFLKVREPRTFETQNLRNLEVASGLYLPEDRLRPLGVNLGQSRQLVAAFS